MADSDLKRIADYLAPGTTGHDLKRIADALDPGGSGYDLDRIANKISVIANIIAEKEEADDGTED